MYAFRQRYFAFLCVRPYALTCISRFLVPQENHSDTALEECFMCLSNCSKGIHLASTRIGSRSKWHGVPKKEMSACLKNRLYRLKKGILVFLQTSLTSRKKFPTSKGSDDRTRRRKRWPNCWPKYRKHTYYYYYYY